MAVPALKKLATPSSAQDWTPEDQQECVRLMCKAQQHGMLDHLFNMVRGSSSEAPPVIMSEATKRLRDPEPLVCGYESGAVPTPMPSSEVAALIKQPGMSKINQEVLDFTMADFSMLPTGLKSMDQWSKCYVSFGKYKDKKTYAQVYLDPQDDDYKVWLFQHYATGSAGLVDLANFLKAMNVPTQLSIKSQGPVIPGSKIVRRFASWRSLFDGEIIGVLFWVTSNGIFFMGETLLPWQGHLSCPSEENRSLAGAWVVGGYQHIYIYTRPII